MVSSTALPNVSVPNVGAGLSRVASQTSAVRWLGQDGFLVQPRDMQGDRVILPIIRPRLKGAISIDYRLAEQLEVDALGEPGTWVVWVDAVSGAPIARKSGIRYASGKVLFDVADRGPHGPRSPQPAPFARFTIGGQTVQSLADGTISWTGTAATAVQLSPIGQFVSVTNKAGAARVAEMVNLPNAGTFTWSKAVTEFDDAQISSYVYANQAKAFTRARLNPNLGWLDAQLSVSVNESSSCNAYSTGDDIHFFRKSAQCENTGRLSDVVYHEFGHSLHANSIIDGVGSFDGALSEGISDWLSSAITHDSGMGRGFFLDNDPLRELNPAGGEKIWGIHTTGEVHDDGEIIGGTLWDLRTALFASLGDEIGYEHWLKISYSIMQRASDIPSSYAEALLADDDDGNIENGTPNQCDIDAVFAAHGLADLAVSLGLRSPARDAYKVTMGAPMPANTSCEVPTVTSAHIEWKLRGAAVAQLPMVEGADGYTADLPEQVDGSVVQYRVLMALSNGTRVSYPNNTADPFYEFYVGPVEAIKCWDFENSQAEGWTNTSDWQVAAPEGLSNDPKEAFGGNLAFGIDLTSDGAYRDRATATAESPEIDTGGSEFIRLQYRRHLAVEDGVFDQARILANGTEVWSNFESPTDNGGTHHIDKEWVFHDVDLKAQAASGKIKLKFELQADEGLAFGGWTVDDVCVVRASGVGLTCGNQTVDDGESCDDGNRVDGDGCDASCSTEGGGCCSASDGVEGALALSVLTFGMVFWRRRRKSAP